MVKERDAIEEVAGRADCPFTGLWLELPEVGRIARVAERPPDASDATADVVRAQSQNLTNIPRNWARLTSDASLETLASTTRRSEEHTSELQSLMRISYAVLCLKKKRTE